MTCPLIEIADAVTAELNRPGLPLAFTARRDYLTTHSPEGLGELETLTVTVQPARLTGQRLSRREELTDYVVSVSVQHRVDVALAALDALMDLVQAIIDRFARTTGPLGATGATCVGYEIDPVFNPEDLGQMELFTSIVTLQFRKAR